MLADMTIGDVDEFLAARIADGGLRRTSAARRGRVSAELFPFRRNTELVPAGHRRVHHAAAGPIPTDRFPRGSIATKSRGCLPRQRVRPR